MACSPRFAPPGPFAEGGGPGPAIEKAAFVTGDGLHLPLRRWLPEGEVQAVIVALHGFNDYAKAFELPGQALAEAGFAVYAYDQRGFGSAPNPGLWAGAAPLLEDVRAMVEILRKRYPGRPVYLLGESMGGAVAILALAGADPPPVQGAILSAPAVWGRDTMGVLPRSALWLARRLAPAWKPPQADLDIQASDNIEMLRDLGRDPLVIKRTRVDAIGGLVDLMDAALASAPRLQAPLLLLYGARDEVIPAEPIRRFWSGLPHGDTAAAARQRLAVYDEGWHLLLRDLQAETVYRDIAAWIAEPQRPLPSRAGTRAGSWLTEE